MLATQSASIPNRSSRDVPKLLLHRKNAVELGCGAGGARQAGAARGDGADAGGLEDWKGLWDCFRTLTLFPPPPPVHYGPCFLLPSPHLDPMPCHRA